MAYVLKTESEAVEYFERAARTCSPGTIILFHNQRKTILAVLREAALKAGRVFLEQDLSVLAGERIGTSRFENKVPDWLAPAFEHSDKKGTLIYLREFHFAADRVKDDAMNVILKKEVENIKLPENTLVVMGLLDMDDEASGLTGTHSVTFYRQPA